MVKKTLVRSSREPNYTFDLFEPEEGIEELYVDGSVGMRFSPSNVKVDFYSLLDVRQENGTNVEERLVRIRLILPMDSWLEICENTLSAIRRDTGVISGALDQYTDKVMRIVGIGDHAGSESGKDADTH
jgi:hypothetical protein